MALDSELVFEERISEHLDGLYRTALRLEGSEPCATELVAAAGKRRELSQAEFRLEVFRWLFQEARWVPPEGLIAPRSMEFTARIDLNRVSDSELLEAIDGLELPFRLALWLHDVEGFSVKEVSQLLQLAPDDAKRCLYGARAKVQEDISRVRLRA